MATFSSRMLDIVNEVEKNTQQTLLEDMKEFPCLFNIMNCKLDIGNTKHSGINICEPDLSKNKWESLREDLEYDNEDCEFEDVVWKENLLTFVFAELGKLEDALKLNKEIQEKHGMNNLVTLANAVFLFYRKKHFNKGREMIGELRKLKSDTRFVNLKIEAACELGYAFRKCGGAKHLLCSISLLELSLSVSQDDERLKFMLAMVYRRCTHFNIYSSKPENINRHDCGLKAAQSLFKLGSTSRNKTIKTAALIELAYFKFNDDIQEERGFKGEQIILSREEWFRIVQGRTWRHFCEEAIRISSDNPTEKVLKMAGQLYRYCRTDEGFKKSEELLKKAIELKPSNRAHHHLGLTYKKMAIQFERREQGQRMHRGSFKNMEGTASGSYGRQYWPNRHARFSTAERDTESANNDNQYVHSFKARYACEQKRQNPGAVSKSCGRQYWPNRHDKFSREERDTESSNGDNQNVHSFKTRHAFEQKRQKSNMQTRSYKYNREDEVDETFQDEVDEKFQVLPNPLPDSSPQKLDKNLKYIVRVLRERLLPFSQNNISAEKAIFHFRKAVEISHYQNIPAVYDLAYILAQTGQYDESKEKCKIIISECGGSKQTSINYPVYLVNAHNLYGVCCAKQAEEIELNKGADKTEERKNDLLTESEKYLTLAVRLAAQLANIPELTLCATDLWNAFRTLKRKFSFEGQKESREKLFKICEFISDYRFLQAVDDIISLDPTELEKIEVIEQCLQRYLNMKAYDSALLFRDIINLRPEVKAKLSESKVYKQLMLEVAEAKLDKVCVQVGSDIYDPDPVWKQLFSDEFQAASNSKKYDIVIVSDVDDNYQLKEGMMSDISEYLKLVLLETFGLNVVRAHEEVLFGWMYMEEKLQIISSSHVSLFVLTAPYTNSLSLASEIAGLRISESEHTVPESAAVNNESQDCCTPEGAENQNENENSVSRMYERIINASISNVVSNVGATRMMLVVPYTLKREDLPQAVRGLPTVVLSQSEIEILTTTVPDRSNEQGIETLTTTVPDRSNEQGIETLTTTVPNKGNEQRINLMKKIFHAVIGIFKT